MNYSSNNLVHSGPVTLPLPLIQAQQLCFQKTAVMDLSQTARCALSGIIAFIKVSDPIQKIWPRRETLKNQARLNSESSLYRGLSELEKKGYIVREVQMHNKRNGQFHSSRIGLTEKSICLLNLIEEKIIHKTPSTKMKDGHIKNIVKRVSSYEELPANQEFIQSVDKKIQQHRIPAELHTTDQISVTSISSRADITKSKQRDPQNPSIQILKSNVDRTKLPQELEKLTKLGLSHKVIFWLMKIAKEKQKRLEDVINFSWNYLEKVSQKGTSALKAYLLTLLNKNQDFTFQLKEIKEKQHEKESKVTKQRLITYIIKNKQGYYVHDRSNQVIGIVEGEMIHFFPNKETGLVSRYFPLWQINPEHYTLSEKKEDIHRMNNDFLLESA